MSKFEGVTDDELQAELKRRRDEKRWKPRTLESFTDEEKIRAFDAIHGECLRYWGQARQHDQWDSFYSGEIAEVAMISCLGEGFTWSSIENAPLVAAAPDYYAGVEKMLANEDRGGDGWWEGWEMLKAAHARANGEPCAGGAVRRQP